MTKGLQNDLENLEQLIRKLEFEYDQFFGGQLRSLPLKTEGAIEQIIRAYGGRAIQNPAVRFRYTNLVARYNTFRRVWDRRVREMEEGRAIGRPRKTSGRPAPPPRPRKMQRREFVAASEGKGMEMEEIFSTYKELREECGESTERLRLESFSRILAEKVEKMRSSKKCDKVEVRLRTENNKCRILVRPSREGT